MEQASIKGRGAQSITNNKFEKFAYDYSEEIEGSETGSLQTKTSVFFESPLNIISKNDSDDLGFSKSINPYQGCEHGCIYCYARNSHEYWGFNIGIDFESKIVVKQDAPVLLERKFLSKQWSPEVIALSGNTDCYQPLERKYKITRNLLRIFAKYRNPVGLITKNKLITRDIDILKDLAKDNLVHVMISLTTLNEDLRRLMEPRTSSGEQRLEAVKQLSDAGIPTGVMIAPIIPSLNDEEIPELLKQSAEHGARSASYTVVRLNGGVGELFKDWLQKKYPNRSSKVISKIESLHGGQVNDTEWGRRLKGEGNYSMMIEQLFKKTRNQYSGDKQMPQFDVTKFRFGGNYTLF